MGNCERCGMFTGIMSFHHRKKRSQGGNWSCENVVFVCGHGTVGCHSWIEGNANAAEETGFHVRPWQNPEDVAILTALYGWVQLDKDGGYECVAPEGGSLPHEVTG